MPNSSKVPSGSVPFPFCALDATQRGLWADAPNHADISPIWISIWDMGYNVHQCLVTSVGVTLTSL